MEGKLETQREDDETKGREEGERSYERGEEERKGCDAKG
jgi:hypothetical protein